MDTYRLPRLVFSDYIEQTLWSYLIKPECEIRFKFLTLEVFCRNTRFSHGMANRYILDILRGIEYLSQHDIVCREISASSCMLVTDYRYSNITSFIWTFQVTESLFLRRTNVKLCLMKNFRQLEYRNCDFIEDDLNVGMLLHFFPGFLTISIKIFKYNFSYVLVCTRNIENNGIHNKIWYLVIWNSDVGNFYSSSGISSIGTDRVSDCLFVLNWNFVLSQLKLCCNDEI